MNRILECALYYIERGWTVLPLYTIKDSKCTCPGKKPCKPGKHPYGPLVPNGSKDATTDEKTVRRWFGGKYNVNIGICAGKASGLVLLDIDPRHGGNESLSKFSVPETLQVITGSLGSHYYFSHPGCDVRNSTSTLAPGLDVRAEGGYCVAPPSKHISGNEYRWKLDPRAVEIAPCPEWIYKSNGQEKKTQCDKLGETIEEGTRDNALTSLAGTMRAKGMQFEEIYAALQKVNEKRCKPPKPDSDIERIARSVSSNYKPRKKRYHRTDAGNAERFAGQYKAMIVYDHNRNKWLCFDGKRWNEQIGNVKAGRFAIRTARSILEEASRIDDEDQRKKLVAWAFKSKAAGRLQAMQNIAKKLPLISTYSDCFDNDKFLFNCLNGTIDLRTGKLRRHDPKDMITKIAPVIYDPDAKFELWDNVLKTAFDGDETLLNFVQRAFGYSITGDISEEKLFLVHGDAASSKSTILEAIKSTLGQYAQIADFESFLKQRVSSHGPRNDIATLAGARFVVSIEVDEGKHLAEGLIKMLTGGDTIRARFLFQESFEFLPQFKLWLACNHAPIVNDADEAMWRRILLVPFNHVVPKNKRDPRVKAVLRDPKVAGPAILAWLVRGCLERQKSGLIIPQSIEEATGQYRDEQDPLKEFFEDECELAPDAFVPVMEMRQKYDEWAKASGIKWPLSPRKFNKRMESRGCRRVAKKYIDNAGETKTGKCWIGVTIKASGQYDSEQFSTVLEVGDDDDTPI
ncbi:MAG: DNA primase [Planctomycetes bacterium]|nr:DNA primase [Planctomycetota bacterium]